MLFTSCGTEANNHVVEAALARFEELAARRCCADRKEKGAEMMMTAGQAAAAPEGLVPHVVSTNVEHPSVGAKLAKLEREGR